MNVTVVTNVDMGWDNVVGVYLDEKIARENHIGEYFVFSNKPIIETKFEAKTGELKTFRENKDILFLDGQLAGETSMQKDKNYALKLQESISNFKSDLDIQVAWNEEHEYYIIAVINPPKDFDPESNESYNLSYKLTEHYENDGLVFH